MSELSSELNRLINLKERWLKDYQGFANSLCLAILAVGVNEDMGDPVNIQRHHMTCKSRSSDDGIKIVATYKSGSYIITEKKFAETLRLMVIAEGLQPVYITFTNDTQVDDRKFNVFIPGKWMDFAKQILSIYDDYTNDLTHKELIIKLETLQRQMLTNAEGFGESYLAEKESEVEF